jgi:predicted cobalt transporter CbtA
MTEAKELFRNPKFVAVWIAIWAGLLLAIMNLFTKISLLMQLGQ